MNVPGQSGWTVTGDKTVEFARFPLDFIKNRIEKHESRVFLARVLNKPTIFVTSNKGVKEILIDKEASFKMGYKDFGYMQALYGSLFLFEDDEEAYKVRSIVRDLFNSETCKHYMQIVERITEEKLCRLGAEPAVNIYEVLKDLATFICLSVFLDVNTQAEFETVKAIATTHWHGLISIPMNLKLNGWSSSYSKAEEAKSNLLHLILNKLKKGENNGRFLQKVKESGFKDETTAAEHVLLFVSAMIPKAISSLITSFVLETAGESKKNLREKASDDIEFLNDVLLEVQRLWPPLFGGRRFTTEEVVIDGYKIPTNHCVAYISRYANRDHDTFHQADLFKPARWRDSDKEKKNLVWTFGAGSRSCIGIHFIDGLLRHISKYLLKHYKWTIASEETPVYKTLPVARPKDSVFVAFVRKLDNG